MNHLNGKPQNFRSVLYMNTAHEYLTEMHDEMSAGFKRALPVNP